MEKHAEEKNPEEQRPPSITTIEKIERETKSICCEINKDVRCMCHCCLRTWSCSLKIFEGCCFGLSEAFSCLSRCTNDCGKCTEYVDCEK